MTLLQEQLAHECHGLGVRINLDFELELASGRRVFFEAHLPDFGGEKGILLTSGSEVMHGIGNDVVDMGFGYSILSEPTPDSGYGRDGVIALLADWTWCGDPQMRPQWLPDQRPDDESDEV
jgi:hypothetical protein